MRALFWKLFGAFWLTTVVILALSIFVSFKIADEQASYPFADPREIDQQLREILERDGVEGLEAHIGNAKSFPSGQTVYLVDSSGKDLLNRKIPERVHRRAQRIWSSISGHRRDLHESDRRAARLLRWRDSLLFTKDGRTLLAMPGHAPPARFGFLLAGNGRWVVLGLAAAISLLVFWLLSRSLVRPVVRISEAAAQLASGNMASRVGKSAYKRDEIGQLAEQFDRMASELEQQSTTRLEMFRNIAHELRAPLTRLQIATELLERKPDSTPQQLKRVRYEIERIEALASQVLTLARAEQAQRSNESTSLSQIARQVVMDAEYEAEACGVRIKFTDPGGDILVRGDADGVSSAIENVVRNAIQYTPAQAEVSVIISEDEPGTVTVIDSGPGVPDKDSDKIFEPFYRINTNRPGAGIGLAITRRVLQQLGGSLAAVNRAEGGLQITMRFPLAHRVK